MNHLKNLSWINITHLMSSNLPSLKIGQIDYYNGHKIIRKSSTIFVCYGQEYSRRDLITRFGNSIIAEYHFECQKGK